MKGLITRIQRFSTTNGPGLRTTVFMKGCPLRCLWCHNPETQKMKRELLYYEETCIKCGSCADACPEGVHLFQDGKHVLLRENCVVCGACADVCPVRALELSGEEIEAEELVARLLRDRAFYEHSGGGITLSGGEPLFQPAFTEEVLRRCKAEGIHTCVDTSGAGVSCDTVARFTREGLADLWLYDLKETDEERHRAATGVPLTPILRNLETIGEAHGKLRLRCPVIPGVNDREEHMEKIGEIAEKVPGVLAIDLVPYHRLGLVKAEALGEQQKTFEALPETRKKALLGRLQEKTDIPSSWI